MIQLSYIFSLKWRCVVTFVVAGLFLDPLAPVSAGIDSCPEGYEAYSIRTTPICVQKGASPLQVPSAVGVHALFFGDFHLATEGFLPNGTRGLRVSPARLKPLDTSLFEPGPYDGTRISRFGPFINVYADELTMRGHPVAIDCAKPLDPDLDNTPAQRCSVRGWLSDTLTFRLTVFTFSWLKKPAWPVFDAQYAETWPTLLADLDDMLAQFIILPE